MFEKTKADYRNFPKFYKQKRIHPVQVLRKLFRCFRDMSKG